MYPNSQKRNPCPRFHRVVLGPGWGRSSHLIFPVGNGRYPEIGCDTLGLEEFVGGAGAVLGGHVAAEVTREHLRRVICAAGRRSGRRRSGTGSEHQAQSGCCLMQAPQLFCPGPLRHFSAGLLHPAAPAAILLPPPPLCEDGKGAHRTGRGRGGGGGRRGRRGRRRRWAWRGARLDSLPHALPAAAKGATRGLGYRLLLAGLTLEVGCGVRLMSQAGAREAKAGERDGRKRSEQLDTDELSVSSGG